MRRAKPIPAYPPFTAVFMKVSEGYVAFVEELPGANTQGATLAEARRNLKDAVEVVLEANRELDADANLAALATERKGRGGKLIPHAEFWTKAKSL